MLTAWCRHYQADIPRLKQFGVNEQSIAQGYCMKQKQNDLSEQLIANNKYDPKYYQKMPRSAVKSMQFLCTREHLY